MLRNTFETKAQEVTGIHKTTHNEDFHMCSIHQRLLLW